MLNKYDKYRPTGLEWIKEIPSHWKIVPLQRIANLRSGTNLTSEKIAEKGLFPVYGGNGIRGYFSDYNNEGNYVLIGRQGALCGNINYATGRFWATEHAVVCYPIMNVEFYWLGEVLRIMNLNQYSISSAQPGLSVERINQLGIPVPPLEEQKRIVSYLNKKCSSIDVLIRELEQQLKDLQQLRLSEISRVVTKGLNPKVPMKNSQIEWLGEIPMHWKVVPFKRAVDIHNGTDYKHVIAEEGYPVIGSGGQFAYASDYLYDGEAVLLGRKGTIDKPLYVNGKFWVVDTMFYATPYEGFDCQYLYYQSLLFPFGLYSTSTALPSMTQTDLGNNPICIPTYEEQQKIASYLDDYTTKIDSIISEVQLQIADLKSYKTSVISEAVTGKICLTD